MLVMCLPISWVLIWGSLLYPAFDFSQSWWRCGTEVGGPALLSDQPEINQQQKSLGGLGRKDEQVGKCHIYTGILFPRHPICQAKITAASTEPFHRNSDGTIKLIYIDTFYIQKKHVVPSSYFKSNIKIKWCSSALQKLWLDRMNKKCFYIKHKGTMSVTSMVFIISETALLGLVSLMTMFPSGISKKLLEID